MGAPGYEFEGFRVDARLRVVHALPSQQRVELQPRVFDALLYFLERPGELLGKRELLAALWPNVIVEENSLNQVVSQLRKALGERPSEHRFLVTAPGRGYRWVGAVQAWADTTSEPRGAHPLSLTVLPFSDLPADTTPADGTAGASQGLPPKLGEAVAADLAHLLSARSRLRVAAHTSSAEPALRELPLQQVGHRLNVARLVTGELSGDAQRLQLTIRLVDARSGGVQWQQSLQGDLKGLAELQGTLARQVAQVIDPQTDHRIELVAEVSPQAYLAYLRALSLSQRPSPEGVGRSVELLQQALALSPQFARAHSLLAIQYTMSVMFGFADAQALQLARQEVATALALDEANGETWCAAGVIDCLGGNWLRAEDRFRIAHSLTADAVVSGLRCAQLTLSVGQVARAYQQAEYTLHVAPTHPIGVQMLAVLHLTRGEDEAARRYVQLSVDQGQSPTMAPLADLIALLELRAGQGNAAESRARIMNDLAGSATLDPPLRKRLLVWHTCCGDLDQAFALAFDSLDHFAREGTVGGAWGVLWLPEMQTFRDDARFQLFARRLRLFEYWSEYGPPDGYSLAGERLVPAA